MNIRNLLILALAGFLLIGCNTSEKYAANNAAGQKWLDEHRSGAGLSVGGTWYSDVWGNARLTQNGRSVMGSMGNYNVRGVVSGQRAYLLLHSNGWVYYTAVVSKPSASELYGAYSASVPFSQMDQEELRFRRQFE